MENMERGRESEGGWQLVDCRRTKGKVERNEKEWVTVFARNFSEICPAAELKRIIPRVGEVVDVFILEKKNKLGKSLVS